jgi:pyruvate formate lyase activating enzyme
LQARIALRKTSLVDFPGKVASVFFFPSCCLRCPWCQNRELVLEPDKAGLTCVSEGLSHITERRRVLGGVVLSGGEPAAFGDLPDLIRELKALGLPVKLDTNGMYPGMLERLFSAEETSPDYIALDLKLAPDRYRELLPSFFRDTTAGPGAFAGAGEKLRESAALLRSSGIAHEYRSLALPGNFFGLQDIEALAPLVDNGPWYFRPFRPGNCLDPSWDGYDPPDAGMVKALAAAACGIGKNGICP